MTTPVLELRGVNKSFGPIDVLNDISLKVNAGEVLCLLGDNGAGKSTLIKISQGCTSRPPAKSTWMASESSSKHPRTPPTAASRRSTSLAALFR